MQQFFFWLLIFQELLNVNRVSTLISHCHLLSNCSYELLNNFTDQFFSLTPKINTAKLTPQFASPKIFICQALCSSVLKDDVGVFPFLTNQILWFDMLYQLLATLCCGANQYIIHSPACWSRISSRVSAYNWPRNQITGYLKAYKLVFKVLVYKP